MATLVLSTVGTLVGGPLGGALGAVLGGAIDRSVFKPKGREGPRLSDLAIQTSTYGAAIPQLFGTLRVAGTVIWSTDLIERATTSGGGKRGPETTGYSYSASFAVALSARRIREVRRIWADGKLLRGTAGDWKTTTIFRLHRGGEAQAVDPLLASAEGIAATPAHRGIAYAVFEELALADFGNRIPSLTFEVVADEAAVTIGGIAEAISDGLVAGRDATTRLGGYAAYGGNLGEVVRGLADASGTWLAEAGDGLALRGGDGDTRTIADAGVSAEGKQGTRRARSVAAIDVVPKSVAISYHDSARDYQTGLQRAERPGAGTRATRIELPAVLAAGDALAMATETLRRADLARERRRVALDWRGIACAPGERVRIAGESGSWRIADWRLEGMVLALELVRIGRAALPPGVATPGRVTAAADVPHGPTTLFAFEIPPIDDLALAAPRLTVAAAGASSGWRAAALSLSSDGGASWQAIGRTRGIATLGQIAVAPGTAPSTLVDRQHHIDVVLANAAMTLNDADAVRLDAGANLALVGDELVQFGSATRIGPARWRLSELWRGRRGSEWAAGTQAPGDRFVLLDPGTLLQVDVPAGAIGATVHVMAEGIGDAPAPPIGLAVVSGASVVPPAPVHLRAERQGADLVLRWTRRSRSGWRWLDGVDAPLVEEAERYQISGLLDQPSEVSAASFALPAAQVLPGASAVTVRQLGLLGLSRPARVSIP